MPHKDPKYGKWLFLGIILLIAVLVLSVVEDFPWLERYGFFIVLALLLIIIGLAVAGRGK